MTNRILYILERYLNGIATPDEIREVDVWYDSFENNPGLDLSNEKEQRFKYEKTVLQNPQS